VAGFSGSGAWAERQAVTTEDLSVVPDEVDLSAAAALPAAGVTALQAVRRLGALLGKRVLITGASGGVGRFAVQLASLSGAEVIAAVGATARGEGLLELGASQLVTALDQVDRGDGSRAGTPRATPARQGRTGDHRIHRGPMNPDTPGNNGPTIRLWRT
jgi:NADPH:quinone reductase-like Zn-dependent oxidoreductase